MSTSGTDSSMMVAEVAAEIVSQKLGIILSRPDWPGCLSIKTLVKDAEAKLALIQNSFSTRDRPSKTKEWWGRLLQAMYDAEDILNKFHVKVAGKRHEALHVATWPIAALAHKCMLWRDLSNLGKAMKQLCQDLYLIDKKEAGGVGKKEPARSCSHASAPWEGQKLARLTNFWDWQASTNYDCHDASKTDIMNWIGDELESLISIWGEQGTGKTFLARWVYGKARYLGFDTQAWVHVSAGMNQQEFLSEILKQVDRVGRDVTEFDEISEMLNQILTKTKRFLIVLDDVRESDEQLLQKLLMFINPSSQGNIITTTRDATIARLMSGNQEPIHLGDLSEEKRKIMLATKLHRGPHDQTLTPEEVKILRRLPAFPLCISLLGGLLSYAKDLERTALANDVSKISVSDLLLLSYHRLPVHLKPCFIYMAMFPVASPISTRRLVRLWLGQGLLNSHCCDRERIRTPEDVGETFLLELVDRNLIDVVSWRVDGSPKACQMLTSLYDLICSTMMNMGFLHVHNASKLKGTTVQQQQPLPKVWWLAEHTNIVRDGHSDNCPALDLGHVHSFLSFHPRRGKLTKDISTFLRKMTSKADYSVLRVLDLEGAYKPSLQGVLRKLVLLRYLGLRSTALDSIPREIVDLHYLETLDLKHTNITSLPSSLWKARNLRHLHLSWFYIDLKKILKACSNNVMALSQLQTLGALVIGEAKENSLTDHMNSLTTLTKLKLFLQHSDNDTSGTAGKTVARWISFKLTNLQSLTFGVIQEAKATKEAAEEAEPAENIPAKETDPAIEAKPAEEPKPAQPAKETKPAEGAQEAANPPEEAKPATSQIGPLPELSLAQHHQLLDLYLLGQLENPIWTQLLPGSLRVLTLSGSEVKTPMIAQLGGLLRNLRTLRLLANSFLGNSLRFIKDGFPRLTILKIWKLPQLKEVIIDPGAMPHLKELDFRHLDRMNKIEGIHHCSELETICVTPEVRLLVWYPTKTPVGSRQIRMLKTTPETTVMRITRATASP